MKRLKGGEEAEVVDLVSSGSDGELDEKRVHEEGGQEETQTVEKPKTKTEADRMVDALDLAHVVRLFRVNGTTLGCVPFLLRVLQES